MSDIQQDSKSTRRQSGPGPFAMDNQMESKGRKQSGATVNKHSEAASATNSSQSSTASSKSSNILQRLLPTQKAARLLGNLTPDDSAFSRLLTICYFLLSFLFTFISGIPSLNFLVFQKVVTKFYLLLHQQLNKSLILFYYSIVFYLLHTVESLFFKSSFGLVVEIFHDIFVEVPFKIGFFLLLFFWMLINL